MGDGRPAAAQAVSPPMRPLKETPGRPKPVLSVVEGFP